MINGQTLQEVAREVSEELPRKRDIIVSTPNLRMITPGSIELTGLDAGTLSFTPRPNFHSQPADRLVIPDKYYNRMQADAPELLVTNVNRWLQKPEKRLVRLISEATDGSLLGRAFLSDRYRPLDNFDLVAHVAPKIHKAGAVVKSCKVTESSLYIQAIFPKIEREVKVGDAVQSGIIIRNSEIGHGSLSIMPLVYRLVCTNGMIVQDQGLKRYHIGKRQGSDDNSLELFRDETLRKMDTAFWSQVEDVVDNVLSETTFDAIVNRLKVAAGVKLVEPVKSVEVTAKHFGLIDAESEAVMRNLIEGGDVSVWGLGNAITALANDHTDYDRGVQLEQIGGQVIELPQDFWKN